MNSPEPPLMPPIQPGRTNLRTCADCGKDVSIHAESCPHCGALLVRKKKHGVFFYVFWGVISLFLTLLILGFVMVCLTIGLPAFVMGFSNAQKAASSQLEITATAETNSVQPNTIQNQKLDYIKNQLQLYDFSASYQNSDFEGKIPGVDFKIRNNGARTLNEIEVTVYFKDVSDKVIWEERYYPVLVTKFGMENNAPLKPGYIWQAERGHFYAAKKVPSEWNEGSAVAKITNIKFADSSGN